LISRPFLFVLGPLVLSGSRTQSAGSGGGVASDIRERLALTSSGQVRYTLKTPYRDGTTHIVREPLDLMARLAALGTIARTVAAS
jgi:hypothetical protein